MTKNIKFIRMESAITNGWMYKIHLINDSTKEEKIELFGPFETEDICIEERDKTIKHMNKFFKEKGIEMSNIN